MKNFWILFIFLTILIVLFNVSNCENYCSDPPEDPDDYDYDAENPNAELSGKIIGGTVYSSYPDKTPGLGWVL